MTRLEAIVMLKQITVLMLGLSLVTCLTGCGSSQGESATNSGATTSAETQASHVDEFTITDVTKGEANSYGYYDLDVTVQNNTDEAKNFLGFSVNELDANGNILKSYTVVEPGQQYHIKLTEAVADGIAGFQSRGYEYGDSINSSTKGSFSTPCKVMF
jgi:hypothetical protein